MDLWLFSYGFVYYHLFKERYFTFVFPYQIHMDIKTKVSIAESLRVYKIHFSILFIVSINIFLENPCSIC